MNEYIKMLNNKEYEYIGHSTIIFCLQSILVDETSSNLFEEDEEAHVILVKEDSQLTSFLSQNLIVPKFLQQHTSFKFVKSLTEIQLDIVYSLPRLQVINHRVPVS